MKPIRLSKHALGYTATRGFTVAEVEEAIRTCAWGARRSLAGWIAAKIFHSVKIGTARFTRRGRFAPCLWTRRKN